MFPSSAKHLKTCQSGAPPITTTRLAESTVTAEAMRAPGACERRSDWASFARRWLGFRVDGVGLARQTRKHLGTVLLMPYPPSSWQSASWFHEMWCGRLCSIRIPTTVDLADGSGIRIKKKAGGSDLQTSPQQFVIVAVAAVAVAAAVLLISIINIIGVEVVIVVLVEAEVEND